MFCSNIALLNKLVSDGAGRRHTQKVLCLILEVYRMWDYQYSRIRMRILHFNIRGYRMRMRILQILLY